ncbi:MAG: hypothetical protein SEPTF4163_004364 [Sporothrix epigloea]
MPFNPFTSVTGRNALTLFDIRLENDFIVFRGNDHEASGQLLKGVLVICVPSALKIEDIHLRLTGTQRLSWTDPKLTPSGLTSTKIDRSNVILNHQWAPFWGTPGKSAILEKGNYEFPFELMLPGDTCESVEGLHEASVVYKIKATIARGKLAYDLHAYKHLRIVRTLESSALEFLHAMSVENIWPNKVEYSIVVPQKAVVFGSQIPLESRFTPLLKGLELGDITVKLIEIHEFFAAPSVNSSSFSLMREFRNERMVQSWNIGVSREEHWQEMIEDTGQEGWVINWSLDLPRKLGRCIQDVNVHGIKVRHKLKMVVALKNPDGHVSELRATLPLTIFISPNIPLDEQGNLTAPSGPSSNSTSGLTTIAPPGYGEHILDQLYDDVEIHNLQTPAPMSAVHSPIYGLSRAGSSENLASMNAASIPVHPAALTSRLQDVSARELALRRNFSSSGLSHLSSSVDAPTPFTPIHLPHSFMHRSASNDIFSNAATGETHSHPQSEVTSRRNSGESRHSEGDTSDHSGETGEVNEEPEVDMQELCKVPSYATAIKSSRIGPIRGGDDFQLPDYRTAASRPNISRTSSTSSLTHTPVGLVAAGGALTNEPLSLIAETPQEHTATDEDGLSLAPTSRLSSHGNGSASESSDASADQHPQRMHHRSRTGGYQPDSNSTSNDSNSANTGSGGNRWRPLSRSVSFLHSRHSPSSGGDTDEHAWLRLSQARDHVAT